MSVNGCGLSREVIAVTALKPPTINRETSLSRL
jgi:hypothetical protein